MIGTHNHPEEYTSSSNDTEEPILPGVEITEKMLMSKTNRGAPCVYVDGFKFFCDSKGVNKNRFRCHRYSKANINCHCRVTLKDGRAFMMGTHNHELK